MSQNINKINWKINIFYSENTRGYDVLVTKNGAFCLTCGYRPDTEKPMAIHIAPVLDSVSQLLLYFCSEKCRAEFANEYDVGAVSVELLFRALDTIAGKIGGLS